MTSPDITAAEHFLAEQARILDRRRFDVHFHDADPAPVRDALAAYRNPDGGFGYGLEPDGRGPSTQPVAIDLALRVLNECDVWAEELVGGACDWLERNAPEEGGARFVDSSIEGWPRGPWWVPEEGLPASLFPTGSIAGTLHARRVDHPWLSKATELMWSRVETVESPGAYDLRGCLRFLQYVPDRPRAEQALDRLAPRILDRFELDPDAQGEVHFPLDFAPEPDSLARRLFDDDTIDRHLDHFAAAQKEDGGWMFNWLAWSPAAEADWRGSLTVDALLLLRANGRLLLDG
jgi:hypothetical protein